MLIKDSIHNQEEQSNTAKEKTAKLFADYKNYQHLATILPNRKRNRN